MGARLQDDRDAIIEAAAARGVTNLRVIGSVARGEDTETSDVDLLVDLDPRVGLIALAGLTQELSVILGRPVDLVLAASLKPAVKSEVLADVIPL